MKFNDIRKMAKDLDIKTYRMKKSDMIRSIQRAENNPDCYGTRRVENCDEERCLWRSDCIMASKGEDG